MNENENERIAGIKLQKLSQYLSPDWIPTVDQSHHVNTIQYPEYYLTTPTADSTSEQSLTITEIIATELHSYLLSHIDIYFHNHIQPETYNNLQFQMIELIKQNAIENSNYCRHIITWVIQSHLPKQLNRNINVNEIEDEVIKIFNTLCDEYMKHSPGPWREGVLLEAIRGLFFPTLCHQLIGYLQDKFTLIHHTNHHDISAGEHESRNINDTTLSVSVSEGDDDTLNDSHSSIIIDGGHEHHHPHLHPTNINLRSISHHNKNDKEIVDFASISSVGYNEDVDVDVDNSDNQQFKEKIHKKKLKTLSSSGESVSSRRSLQKMSGQQLPPKTGNSHTLNKLKAEIAILQNELVKAEAADKTILQEKLREYRVDMDVLREKNRELMTRVQELDLQLFQSLVNPIRMKFSNQFEQRRRGGNEMKTILEPDDENFEDAREEATTDSEHDLHSIHSSNSLDKESKETSSSTTTTITAATTSTTSSSTAAAATTAVTVSQTDQDIKKLIFLYEQQFEKMKNEIRYLQLLTKRHSGNVMDTVLRLQPLDDPGITHNIREKNKSANQIETTLPTSVERSVEGKHGNFFTKKQMEKIIAEAVQVSKEIDQKTIKEMIVEIQELNSKLQHQEQQHQEQQQQLLLLQAQEKKSNSLNLNDEQVTDLSPAFTSSSLSSKKHQSNRSKEVSIEVVYSFLFGSLVMLFVSTLLPWIASLWNQRNLFLQESEEDGVMEN